MSNTNQAGIKLCKDCKHFKRVGHRTMDDTYYCDITSKVTIDIVTGHEKWTHSKTCETMRNEYNSCGPSGKLWEKR